MPDDVYIIYRNEIDRELRMAKSAWKDEFIFIAYDLARTGYSENKIAKIIHIDKATYLKYKKKRPLFKMAIAKGTEKGTLSLRDFVYQKLPKRLKKLYNKITKYEKAENGTEKIEALLTRRGMRTRQRLFLYVWSSGNFSMNKALKKVNISRQDFKYWKDNDPDFASLIDEMEWYRENFIEDSLMKLIAGGDTNATIFSAKTKLKHRGYAEKLDVNFNANITHTYIDITQLNLPIDIRKQILEAHRMMKLVESKEVKQLNGNDKVNTIPILQEHRDEEVKAQCQVV